MLIYIVLQIYIVIILSIGLQVKHETGENHACVSVCVFVV